MSTLYYAKVTEHEYEAGWGASTRPDGIAFAKEPFTLAEHFSKRISSMKEQNTSDYSLYEEIGTPRLCKVSEKCLHFYDYKCPEGEVLWLRGGSLEEFVQGVEL